MLGPPQGGGQPTKIRRPHKHTKTSLEHLKTQSEVISLALLEVPETQLIFAISHLHGRQLIFFVYIKLAVVGRRYSPKSGFANFGVEHIKKDVGRR